MKHVSERTFIAHEARCLNQLCRRDAASGQNGYCSPCGQAVRRRVKAGKYTEEDLKARGKLIESDIDQWLKS